MDGDNLDIARGLWHALCLIRDMILGRPPGAGGPSKEKTVAISVQDREQIIGNGTRSAATSEASRTARSALSGALGGGMMGAGFGLPGAVVGLIVGAGIGAGVEKIAEKREQAASHTGRQGEAQIQGHR